MYKNIKLALIICGIFSSGYVNAEKVSTTCNDGKFQAALYDAFHDAVYQVFVRFEDSSSYESENKRSSGFDKKNAAVDYLWFTTNIDVSFSDTKQIKYDAQKQITTCQSTLRFKYIGTQNMQKYFVKSSPHSLKLGIASVCGLTPELNNLAKDISYNSPYYTSNITYVYSKRNKEHPFDIISDTSLNRFVGMSCLASYITAVALERF